MNYKVYGSEFCPRCENAVKSLELLWNTVTKVDMEEMREADIDWRYNWEEKCEATADNAMRNLELPSILCTDTGEWYDYEEIVKDD